MKTPQTSGFKSEGKAVVPNVPFGSNEVRLKWSQWLAVLVIVGGIILSLPGLWTQWESVPFEENYRVPYSLSKDYWLYRQWLGHVDSEKAVYIVGDSVVWGEYVKRDGTLSAFLNAQSGTDTVFVNAGVNGLFPLALEGLVGHYGAAMVNRRVLLHCNLLWMTSQEADLSSEKEQSFNHPRLVPQFSPEIPCYRASYDERLGVLMERAVPFLSFVNHLQNVYFDQKSLYQWTLADDGDYPPSYPNSYRLPWDVVTFKVPGELDQDPDRGLNSSRHKSWSTTGEGSQNFDWVALDQSLQWGAFQRLIELLVSRNNELMVMLGPLNRHIMSVQNQAVFDERVASVTQWLEQREIQFVAPETLPFDLYGDASHPLTQGYRRLAEGLWSDERFQEWLNRPLDDEG
jgi:hypothetical protein